MIDTPEYKTVERAAAFLDSRDDFPDNWRDLIDLDTLDISVACRCVVGQVKADVRQPYRTFVDSIGGAGRMVDLGIDTAFAGSSCTAAWKAYITATRSPANPETDETSGTDREQNTTFTANDTERDHCEGSIRRRVSVSGKGLGVANRSRSVTDEVVISEC